MFATRTGDDGAIAAALHARYQALSMPEHASERASLAASALSHAEAAGATAWSMMARQDRLTALLEMGAIEEFDAELSAYSAVAESVRRPHDLWRSELMHTTIALFRGQMESGTRLAQHTFSTGARLQQPGALQSFAVQMFFIGWQRNRLAGLVPEAESAANANDAVPSSELRSPSRAQGSEGTTTRGVRLVASRMTISRMYQKTTCGSPR